MPKYKKKRYDKKNITSLFIRYTESGEEEIFTQLIEACEPMIDTILARYEKYVRYFEDAKQEVKLKMWKNLRQPKRMKRYCISPTTYLFFVIRAYAGGIFEGSMKLHEDDRGLVSISELRRETEAIEQNIFLEPEKRYMMINEGSEDLFERFVQELRKNRVFSKISKEEQDLIIERYKEDIEFLFKSFEGV